MAKSDLTRDEFGMEDVEDYFSESSVEVSVSHNESISQILLPESKDSTTKPKPKSQTNGISTGSPVASAKANGSRNPFLNYLKTTSGEDFYLSPSRKGSAQSPQNSMESMDISSPRLALQRRSIFGKNPRSPVQTHINSPARRLSSSVTPRIKRQDSTTSGTKHGIVAKMMPTSMLADSEEEEASMEIEQEKVQVSSDEEEDEVDVDDSAMDISMAVEDEAEDHLERKRANEPSASSFQDGDVELPEEIISPSLSPINSPSPPPKPRAASRPKRPEIKKATDSKEEPTTKQSSPPPPTKGRQKKIAKNKARKLQTTTTTTTTTSRSKKTTQPDPELVREPSEELGDGPRRSKRIKVAPLEFWKNERIIYSLEKPAQPGIKAIVHHDSTAEEEAAAALREKRAQAAAQRRKASKRKNSKKHHESDDELDELDEKVIAEQRKEGTLVEKTFLEGSVFKYPPVPTKDGQDNEREDQTIAWGHEIKLRNVVGGTHKVASLFDREARFAAGGVLALKPKGSKPAKPSKQNHYFFFVTTGAVKVDISDVVFTVTKGGSFVVPRGNYYSITNLLDREARMFFVQCTDTLGNKERGITPGMTRSRDSMPSQD